MQRLVEELKVDAALRPVTGVTALVGPYFSLADYPRALFKLAVSGLLTGEDLTYAVYQALDNLGTTPLQLGVTQTIDQGVGVCRSKCKCTTVQVGDTLKLTINKLLYGALVAQTLLTFTAAAAEDPPAREFNQASTDAACAISLAACINDATYGVDGLYAEVINTDEVAIRPTEPGLATFDITELAAAAARLIVTDLVSQAYFEVDTKDLTRDSDYTHVGIRVASVPATAVVSCDLIRGGGARGPIGQTVTVYDDSA